MAEARGRHERIIEVVLLLIPVALVLIFGGFGADAAAGAPAVRQVAADEVLLTLAADPERAATAAREAELRQRPGDVKLAIEIARRHIEDARRNNDPRALGWAEATLAPFADDPASSPSSIDVRVLRATIRQSRHDFQGALIDLNAVLAADPTHLQAALTRATIYSVIGRPADARADCEVVRHSRAHPIVAAVCHAVIDGLTGKADEGISRLDGLLAVDPRLVAPPPPGLASWALATRAELHRSRGEVAAAEADLRAALAATPGDAWTQAMLADLLLDAGRTAEVLPVIGASDLDNLILRRALAEVALGQDASADTTTLRARYAAARARGDVHDLREEARFVLHIEGDAARALELALQNWDHQEEAADARIALETAVAMHAPERVQMVVEHMRATGLDDAALKPLLQALAP